MAQKESTTAMPVEEKRPAFGQPKSLALAFLSI